MSKGQQLGYIRVSSEGQNTVRQLDGIELDRTFEEKISAKDVNRPELQRLIEFARDGDTVHVHSLDRLARNLDDLRSLVQSFVKKGVTVHIHTPSVMIFQAGRELSPLNELVFTMLGAFAQFERSLIRERQHEGIEQAKKAGKYTGGKPKLSGEQVTQLKELVALGVPKAEVARRLGVTRQSVHNYLNAA